MTFSLISPEKSERFALETFLITISLILIIKNLMRQSEVLLTPPLPLSPTVTMKHKKHRKVHSLSSIDYCKQKRIKITTSPKSPTSCIPPLPLRSFRCLGNELEDDLSRCKRRKFTPTEHFNALRIPKFQHDMRTPLPSPPQTQLLLKFHREEPRYPEALTLSFEPLHPKLNEPRIIKQGVGNNHHRRIKSDSASLKGTTLPSLNFSKSLDDDVINLPGDETIFHELSDDEEDEDEENQEEEIEDSLVGLNFLEENGSS